MNRKQILSTFSIALLFAVCHGETSEPAYSIHTRAIKLESGMLNKIDGNFFDGETIRQLKQYQNSLRDFLIGKREADGKRHPQYSFEGNLYTMQQLCELEAMRGPNGELKELLRQIRSEFETLSIKFRGIARGTKPFMAVLVEESCARRGRLNNSLLYTWAKTDEAEEEELFNVHVHTLKDLEMFFTDLHNFLGDLMASCPRARKQFQEKVAKFNKIKSLLPQLGIAQADQLPFLKQINPSLAKLKLEEIDPALVRKLFDEFEKSK